MTTDKINEIKQAIESVLSEHGDARATLATAICKICRALPVGAKLPLMIGVPVDGVGLDGEPALLGEHTYLTVERVHCGASQWSNREWDRTIDKVRLLLDGKLVDPTRDASVFDGHNTHYQRTGWYRGPSFPGDSLYSEGGEVLRAASVANLVDLAHQLPDMIARYLARKTKEVESARCVLGDLLQSIDE